MSDSSDSKTYSESSHLPVTESPRYGGVDYPTDKRSATSWAAPDFGGNVLHFDFAAQDARRAAASHLPPSVMQQRSRFHSLTSALAQPEPSPTSPTSPSSSESSPPDMSAASVNSGSSSSSSASIPSPAATDSANTPLLANDGGGGYHTILPKKAAAAQSSRSTPADIRLTKKGSSTHLLLPTSSSDDSSSDGVVTASPGINSSLAPMVEHDKKLGEFMATSIAGNDITASCLYASGLCAGSGGVYAPISMMLVSFTLYLFRWVYGEAVTALPLNGGAYNVLLNTTSKSTAAVAACLTILSYMATGVVSAADAIGYIQHVIDSLPTAVGTIALLAIFAGLNLLGLTESAVVALCIFFIHLTSMVVLIIASIVYLAQNGFGMLVENFNSDSQPALAPAIFFGFSSAMLGVTGFETSANYVEEQRPGVFVKTLRNMWVLVSLLNPALAFLLVACVPFDRSNDPTDPGDILNHDDDTLAVLARYTSGHWLEQWIAIDAFLVLSGSVLTAFVGVGGLCRRLALDRCLPQFLLARNKWRGTHHWIIIGFLGLCISIYLVLNGSVMLLSNVYSIAFLSVMALFAVGNMLLKYKRSLLRREVSASWPGVVGAFVLVLVALVGTIDKNPNILAYFAIYFLGTGLFISMMFFRVQTLKILYRILLGLERVFGWGETWASRTVRESILSISSQTIAFFTKHGQLSVLNKGVLYVRQNEDCALLRIIHCYEDEECIPKKLVRNVAILDEMYPKVKIDLVLVRGKFSPKMVDELSRTLHIAKNMMFITQPKKEFEHTLEKMGGVRLITH